MGKKKKVKIGRSESDRLKEKTENVNFHGSYSNQRMFFTNSPRTSSLQTSSKLGENYSLTFSNTGKAPSYNQVSLYPSQCGYSSNTNSLLINRRIYFIPPNYNRDKKYFFYLTIHKVIFSCTQLKIYTNDSFISKSNGYIPDLGTKWLFDQELPSLYNNLKNNFYWSYSNRSISPQIFTTSPMPYIYYDSHLGDQELFIVDRNKNNNSFWFQENLLIMNDLNNYVNLDSLTQPGALIYQNLDTNLNLYGENLSILLTKPLKENYGGIILSNYLLKFEMDSPLEYNKEQTFMLCYRDPKNTDNFYRIDPQNIYTWLFNETITELNSMYIPDSINKLILRISSQDIIGFNPTEGFFNLSLSKSEMSPKDYLYWVKVNLDIDDQLILPNNLDPFVIGNSSKRIYFNFDISTLYIENFNTGNISVDKIKYPNIITSGNNWNECWKYYDDGDSCHYFDDQFPRCLYSDKTCKLFFPSCSKFSPTVINHYQYNPFKVYGYQNIDCSGIDDRFNPTTSNSILLVNNIEWTEYSPSNLLYENNLSLFNSTNNLELSLSFLDRNKLFSYQYLVFIGTTNITDPQTESESILEQESRE